MQSAVVRQRFFLKNFVYNLFEWGILNSNMKLKIALQIELPDGFGPYITTAELLETVRQAYPQRVKVNLLVNGEVDETPETPTEVQVQVNDNPNGILPHGTSVRVTLRGEETSAEVIGYDHKYLLHKVRTACGKVVLRKVNQSNVSIVSVLSRSDTEVVPTLDPSTQSIPPQLFTYVPHIKKLARLHQRELLTMWEEGCNPQAIRTSYLAFLAPVTEDALV